jgi:hypothetical protein
MRAFFSDVALSNLEFRQAGVKFSSPPVQWETLIAQFLPQAIDWQVGTRK